MAPSAHPVTVRILEREYQVACAEDERESLQAAAEFVDRRMKEVRQRGNVIGTDRVAVMAALNIAHELLAAQAGEASLARVRDRIEELDQRVEAKLAEDHQSASGPPVRIE